MPPRGEIASVVAARWARSRPHGTVAAPDATALVLGDPAPHLPLALEDRGHTVTRWHRVACPGQLCTPWPPPGPFGEVWVRMPRSSLEAAMLLHAAAGRVRHVGHIHLYGAGTEGIRSAARHFPAGADEPRTALIKARCRVLTAARTAPPPRPDGLDSWKHEARVDWGSGGRAWTFYPGVFAYGRLDPATALLIAALPDVPDGSRVLDFGAGTGPVGAAVIERTGPRTEVHLLEPDAISLAAAAVNVAEATRITGHGLAAVTGHGLAAVAGHGRATLAGPYDLIVSNPPIHAGSAQSLRTVEGLVRGAPTALAKGGTLLLVAQRRLPVPRLLERAFRDVRTAGDQGQFRVWRATGARALSARRGRPSRRRR